VIRDFVIVPCSTTSVAPVAALASALACAGFHAHRSAATDQLIEDFLDVDVGFGGGLIEERSAILFGQGLALVFVDLPIIFQIALVAN